MKKEHLKFVIDSRCFRGSCVTSLSDGIHCDYYGSTLEELKKEFDISGISKSPAIFDTEKLNYINGEYI